MLQIQKFKKNYHGNTVLTVEELNIKPGIYLLSGANGSGKSTLLKCIAGILSFDGNININGDISVKRAPVRYRKLVNFAEAEPLFPEFLTGLEMLRLFAAAKGNYHGQIDECIERMGMQSYIDKPMGSYSRNA